jgi:O-antigen/teichoic acid export membrane protein
VASTAASLVAQVFVARWLGPDANGLLTGATWVLAIAMLLADLGMNTSVSRALAAAYYGDGRAIRRILAVGLGLKVGLTLAVSAALALAAGPLADAIGAGPALAPVLAWTALQLLLDNLATFAFRGLQGLHSQGRLAVGQTISGVTSPVLAAGIVWAGFGASGAVAGRAAGAGLAAIYALGALVALTRALAARQEAGPAPAEPPAAAGALLRDLASFAGRILWVNVAYLVFFRLDQALVQLFLGTRAVGLYGPAAGVIEKCLLPAVAIGTVAAPHFAAASDPARRAGLRSLLERTVRAVTVLYVPAAVGLSLLAPDVVRAVFGSKYEAAGPILRAYAAALLVLAHASLLGTILDYLGLGRARALAFALAAAIDLALNSILLPRFGAIGAIASIAATFTPLVAFYLVALSRRLGASLRRMALDLARAVLAAGAMAAAISGARPALPGGLALAGLVLLGLATYAAALLALGGFPAEWRRGPLRRA